MAEILEEDRSRDAEKNKTLHLVADDYATLKHPTVQAWLDKHPRFVMHFTPTTERLRLGVFTGVPELVTAIDDYVAHPNTDPNPFLWTKSARDILQKVNRTKSRLSAKQNAALH